MHPTRTASSSVRHKHATGSGFPPDSKIVLLILLQSRWDHNHVTGVRCWRRSAPSDCLWEAIPAPCSVHERKTTNTASQPSTEPGSMYYSSGTQLFILKRRWDWHWNEFIYTSLRIVERHLEHTFGTNRCLWVSLLFAGCHLGPWVHVRPSLCSFVNHPSHSPVLKVGFL